MAQARDITADSLDEREDTSLPSESNFKSYRNANMAELNAKATVGILDKDFKKKSHEFVNNFLYGNSAQDPTHSAAEALKNKKRA